MKEHLTNIRKARQYLVESRRALAATLAQYHDEGRSSPDKDAEYADALASIQAGLPLWTLPRTMKCKCRHARHRNGTE
jgi:hypothetical protein